MRNIAYAILLLSFFCCSSVIYADSITQAQEDTKNSMKMNEFIMNGAAQDISVNISLWVSLIKKTESVHLSESWPIVLGDKIPSQPVAVIEVLNLIEDNNIEEVCPRAC